MTRDIFIDTLQAAIFDIHDKPKCEVCGYHKSDADYDIRNLDEGESMASVSLCDNCFIELTTIDTMRGTKWFDLSKVVGFK